MNYLGIHLHSFLRRDTKKDAKKIQKNNVLHYIKQIYLFKINDNQNCLHPYLAEDLEIEHGKSIFKQGLDGRFNQQAVSFLKSVLSNIQIILTFAQKFLNLIL